MDSRDRIALVDEQWERYRVYLDSTGLFPPWHIDCSKLTWYAAVATMIRTFLPGDPPMAGIVCTDRDLFALLSHCDHVVQNSHPSESDFS